MVISTHQLQKFAEYILQANRIAFFGGAGVSTESGLPDYRSKDGRYTAMENDGRDPKEVMHINYIKNHPKEFFKRRNKRVNIEPNQAHHALAQLESMGKDVRIITQNVDGLHQKAGSTHVYELHGSGRTWYCMDCGHTVAAEDVQWEDDLPSCEICSGLVRPGVIYFGEKLDMDLVEESRELIRQSDLLIIAGTSLTVSPAKRLIQAFEGDHVVVINQAPLNTKNLKVDLTFIESVGELLGEVLQLIKEPSNDRTIKR